MELQVPSKFFFQSTKTILDAHGTRLGEYFCHIEKSKTLACSSRWSKRIEITKPLLVYIIVTVGMKMN